MVSVPAADRIVSTMYTSALPLSVFGPIPFAKSQFADATSLAVNEKILRGPLGLPRAAIMVTLYGAAAMLYSYQDAPALDPLDVGKNRPPRYAPALAASMVRPARPISRLYGILFTSGTFPCATK